MFKFLMLLGALVAFVVVVATPDMGDTTLGILGAAIFVTGYFLD